jgi:hypothetical protein
MRKLTTAELAKQMLYVPGVVHSSPPFAADAFQMAKADNDFQQNFLSIAKLSPATFAAMVQKGNSLWLSLASMLFTFIVSLSKRFLPSSLISERWKALSPDHVVQGIDLCYFGLKNINMGIRLPCDGDGERLSGDLNLKHGPFDYMEDCWFPLDMRTSRSSRRISTRIIHAGLCFQFRMGGVGYRGPIEVVQ